MEEPQGFLLRTFEIVKSPAYWEYVFKRDNLGKNEEDSEKRLEFSMEISSHISPWVICENCISKFEVNRSQSKLFMKEWLSKKGDYSPPKSDNYRKYLRDEEIELMVWSNITVN